MGGSRGTPVETPLSRHGRGAEKHVEKSAATEQKRYPTWSYYDGAGLRFPARTETAVPRGARPNKGL